MKVDACYRTRIMLFNKGGGLTCAAACIQKICGCCDSFLLQQVFSQGKSARMGTVYPVVSKCVLIGWFHLDSSNSQEKQFGFLLFKEAFQYYMAQLEIGSGIGRDLAKRKSYNEKIEQSDKGAMEVAKGKTNAMRILDGLNINYEVHSYENKDGKIDGISVADKIGVNHSQVYKTLVVQDGGKAVYVFVIPVAGELDLKKAAKAVQAKKVEMAAVKDIQKLTGYIRGGCSPVGMKKKYQTVLDKSADELPTILVSGGKIGLQIELEVKDLISATEAMLVDVLS